MNKCIILYYSQHHQNIKKILLQIAESYPDISLVSLTPETFPNFSEYDLIGFASGIYMGKPHSSILNFVDTQQKLLQGKKVFTILTSGSNQKNYGKFFHTFLLNHGCQVLGGYQCKGFDTYGIFKFIGGTAKGHPNNGDISKAVSFIKQII
ncbi:MAG: flavodoxin domain-containing protein [Lachnospiraceae bacterium]|nr:flavodoxin domain-containing protein [Lachnospiraceae bacterium]